MKFITEKSIPWYRIILVFPIAFAFILVFNTCQDQNNNNARVPGDILVIDSIWQWKNFTRTSSNVLTMAADSQGQCYDLMGNGALLLSKIDTFSFYKTDHFRPSGEWKSKWISHSKQNIQTISFDYVVYGHGQAMDTGWVKFEGELPYFTRGKNEKTMICASIAPLTPLGVKKIATEAVDHDGDADPCFFNNRWHMFFVDSIHQPHKIDYAWTTPSEFPYNWRVKNSIFELFKPDQKQKMALDIPLGNSDTSLAREGIRFFLAYKWPKGNAYKELNVTALEEQEIQIRIEYDKDGNGTSDTATDWMKVEGNEIKNWTEQPPAQQFRINLRLFTRNASESPLIKKMTIHFNQ